MVAHADMPTENPVPVPLPPDTYDPGIKALARRFGRTLSPELTFEFTRDPGLLHQYFKLREVEYNAYYGLSPLSGAESEHDHKGHIMIVKMGNFCVGGGRINVKTPHKSDLLPMETGDFRVEDYFPGLGYRQLSYGQAGMLVLLPEFRGGSVVQEMVKRICYKAAALNLSVLFATCPWLNARLYRQACVAIGLTTTAIHLEIDLPRYRYLEEIKQYLLSIPVGELLSRELPRVPLLLRERFALEGSRMTTMASSPQLEKI